MGYMISAVVWTMFVGMEIPVADSTSGYFPPPESKGGWRKLDDSGDIRRIAGMDPAKLAELEQWLLESDKRNFAAVVIRRGHIVLEVERGNSAKTDSRRVASVSKAICATVLAIASEQSQQGLAPKKMKFSGPAFDFIPWAKPLSDPRKAKITVKQLFNHTSGITPEATGARNRGPWKHVLGHDGDPLTEKLAFDPGKGCGYTTFAFYHAALVCENVTGKPYDQFAIEALFEPIGVEHWWFQQFADGEEKYGRHPSHAMGMPARDLARIAYCMLHEGRWRGRQVIPRWFVQETTAPTHDVEGPEMRFGVSARTFSHGWQLPARLSGERGRGFPKDARYKPGSGGQLIAFVPSLDLVVTRQTGSSGSWDYEEYLRRACAAVQRESKPNESKEPHRTGFFFPTPGESISNQDRQLHSSAPVEAVAKWSRIELEFRGPDSQGRGDSNPFEIRLDVIFRGPGGKLYQVPGFYDGDGKGGLDGNVWKVRFSADKEGEWTFETESPNSQLDEKTGRFLVTAVPPDAKGFWKWGRLEYTGTPRNGIRYLKFRDGPYWLKAGCDDPENFLGSYRHYDTLAKRKAAVDFLAERGVNSLYMMTHNIGGDDRDVWPWLGKTAREAMTHGGKNARFEVTKLEEWRRLFEHMQQQGVVPYLVLEDDSAWKDYDHLRYYRELIARFGYLPALCFNFDEEYNENYRLPEALEFMRLLEQVDPYDHPRGIHNVNRPNDEYVDAGQVDFTSIQTGSPGNRRGLEKALEHNRTAIEWIDRCMTRKRRILVANFDEARPEEDRRCWWSVYLGGGVWETHVRQPYDRPLSAWEPAWTELGGARAFMETLPFWQMEPNNALVESGKAFCLAKPGEIYALYLPTGGSITVRLAPNASYEYAWWNPANGKDGDFEKKGQVGGGTQQFTTPGSGDWALRIVRKGS